MKTHRIGCTSIGNGRITNQFFTNTTDLRQLINIHSHHMLLQGFISFGSTFNKLFVFQTFMHDIIQHHIQHRHIGTGFELKVIRCVFRQFGLSWVDNDTRFSAKRKLLHFSTSYGMSICRIRPNHHDCIGIF